MTSVRSLGCFLAAYRFGRRTLGRGVGSCISAGLLERRGTDELLFTEKNELTEDGEVLFVRGNCLSRVIRVADIIVPLVGSDLCG